MSAKSSQDPPKIEFPCSYPIKIIGHTGDDFEDSVLAAVKLHTGPLDSSLVKVKPSKNKNYLSVTVTIEATGKDQLQNIFQDLKKIKSVKMVL
jgi:hypothetical protein